MGRKLSALANRLRAERRKGQGATLTPLPEIAPRSEKHSTQRGGSWRGGGPVTPTPTFEEVVTEYDNRTEVEQYRGPGRRKRDLAGYFVIYKRA